MQIEKLVLHVFDVASLIGVSSHKIYEMIQNKNSPPIEQGEHGKSQQKLWKIISNYG